MRVLPRVVVPLPLAGLIAAGAAGVLGLTGCSQFDKSLGQQQAMVSFKAGTPVQVRMQVRTTCGKLPHVTAAPIASSVPLSAALDVVVYRVTGASNADIARLQVCLSRFPSVQGMDLQDATDNS